MLNNIRTRFASSLELSSLPYFELRGEALVLADESIGPIADVHTHLALSYVRQDTVDLRAEHTCVCHYLPLQRELDLDIYANVNFNEDDLKAMKRDLTVGSLTKAGPRQTHTTLNLLREMKELGVHKAVLLPIDFPVISKNAEIYLAEAAEFDALLSLGSVHPMSKNKGERLEQQKRLGARGVKVHPAVQGIAPDHPKSMEIYRACAELDLPVLWHCGPVGIEPKRGRELSQLKHYWPAIHENPDTTFVLGHSGALQMEMALMLAKHYPNVYLETASQGISSVARLLEEAPGRLMHGSDWPFYHQAMSIAKILLLTDERPALRRRVLWENAAQLFGFDA